MCRKSANDIVETKYLRFQRPSSPVFDCFLTAGWLAIYRKLMFEFFSVFLSLVLELFLLLNVFGDKRGVWISNGSIPSLISGTIFNNNIHWDLSRDNPLDTNDMEVKTRWSVSKSVDVILQNKPNYERQNPIQLTRETIKLSFMPLKFCSNVNLYRYLS